MAGEPGQFLQLAGKKEPLLPTPPNTQMVKLDTTLTCQSLYTYIYLTYVVYFV